MRKKLIGVITAVLIACVIFSGLRLANAGRSLHATTRVTDSHVYGVNGETIMYIYVVNPTWQTVTDVSEIDIKIYVDHTLVWEFSRSPDWNPEHWDTTVYPFESSVVLWIKWICGCYPPYNEPTGLYRWEFTIHCWIGGDEFSLKTSAQYYVYL